MRDFDHSLPMLLLRAREAAMSRFRPHLLRHGITDQQWRILRVLMEHNGSDAKELARRTLILKPSLTGILDRMQRDGLVERRRNPDDGRRSGLFLTRRARAIYGRVAPRSELEYLRMQRRMAGGRWETLHESLRELIRVNETSRHKAGGEPA
jgi:homoprotocatechuate degradation regulator HpaR